MIRIEYVPRSGLLALSLVNFLLGLVTFTIYRFWAKTNVRKHVWSCVHINGHPLEYTGRGMELFKGALIVFLVFGLPAAIAISAVSVALGPEHPAIGGIQVLLFLIVSLLWGAAIYRAKRYQLSRTLWRGIRGTLAGSAMTYSLTYFGALLARVVTFGWSTPAMNLNLQQMMIGDMRFGDQAFRFKGRAGPLYPSYALCWCLTLAALVAAVILTVAMFTAVFGADFDQFIVDLFAGGDTLTDTQSARIGYLIVVAVIGLVLLGAVYSFLWSIYVARELRLFADYTGFDKARFRYNATAGSLIWLAIGNLLIWVLTLGIGQPYVVQRLIRYLCDRLTVEGTIDIDSIRQSMAPLDTMGEGLADAFDVGGI